MRALPTKIAEGPKPSPLVNRTRFLHSAVTWLVRLTMLLLSSAFSTLGSATTSRVIVLNGHRALLLGPTRATALRRPPLVLLGGTAQWLDSWTGHLSGLARERQVLLYEVRGQGGATSDLDVADCSLRQQAADFGSVVEAAGLNAEPFDVVGFSFGGRVAMAAAAHPASARRYCVRRLCVTGVAADRGAYGRLAVQGWRASLSTGDLEGFVWQLILSTHSPSYLAAHERNVPLWVRAVVQANSVEGLRSIVEQTHTDDPTDSSHPSALAAAIRAGVHHVTPALRA